MKRSLLCFFFSCLFSLTASLSLAQTRRGMMANDTLRVAGVGDAQISPDGAWIVYTLMTTEGDAAHTTLWITRASLDLQMTTATRAPARLLAAGWGGSNPRWSPDSKRIAFLAVRDTQSGIWVVSLADRQPRLVAPVRTTNFHIAYAGEPFAWSPDGRRIAFISASKEESDTSDTTASKGRDDPRVIDRIQYKSRTSFSDSMRTHVWVTDVDDLAPRQLTSGPYYDHALTWNPHGDEIAFLSNHESDPDANNNSDIFAVSLDGRVRQVTQTKGCEYEPAWSPDGKWIAYTATTRDVTTIDSIAEDAHVWVVDVESGRQRELNAAQDRRTRVPSWSRDSRTVFFLASDHGGTSIYRVGIDGSDVRRITALRGTIGGRLPRTSEISHFQVTSFTTTALSDASVRIALTLTDAIHPAEVWMTTAEGVLMRRISAHNDALMNAFTIAEPEELSFKSFDGTTIQGWLMKPVGFVEGRRYPLILSVHGGPHGMYGYSFNPAFQVYAARGYAVLYLNPRGSSGYGQKFSDGTLREWGGGDYRDLMLGVDEVLRTRPWIDKDHLGVTGGSYGGFMTNWIITQTPRFRAAVASASVSNLVSFYATSLYQDLIHAEFGGFPWDDYDLLWRWSPLRYVRAVETPTLFIHGEQDNDVHITQAEEMYMALRRRGIETVLVRYPREGHGLREPSHRTDALERTIAWFDKYLYR